MEALTDGGAPVVEPEQAEARAASLALDLLRETREEVGRADGKATTLLAAVLVVIGFFVAGAAAGQWSPLRLRTAGQALFWLGMVGLIVGITLLCTSIYPNVGNQAAREVLGYFGHVTRYRDRAELKAALLSHSAGALDRITDQLFVISRIVTRKYWFLRWGMWALALGAGLAVVANLLELLHWD